MSSSVFSCARAIIISAEKEREVTAASEEAAKVAARHKASSELAVAVATEFRRCAEHLAKGVEYEDNLGTCTKRFGSLVHGQSWTYGADPKPILDSMALPFKYSCYVDVCQTEYEPK
jgi:hypothetical protein